MDTACIKQQLQGLSPGGNWQVAAVEDGPDGSGTEITLQNGNVRAKLSVEEGNSGLGSYFSDGHARYFFRKEEQPKNDEGLHTVVTLIAEKASVCYSIGTSQPAGDAPGIVDFYLPLALLAAFLLASLPPVVKYRFSLRGRLLLKKSAINFAVLCCGIVLAFGFAEMLVRISQINPMPGDRLAAENGRYHMIPSGDGELQVPPDYYTVEQVDGESFWNPAPEYRAQFGRRGYPPQMEEDSDLRLLAVGDSILFGSGVSEKNTFLRRAEELFRTSHPKIKADFINLSQPGWNFAQYKIALERTIRDIKPRMVLVAFWSGDIKNVVVQNGFATPANTIVSKGSLLSPRIPLRMSEQRLLAANSRFFALLFSVMAENDTLPQRLSDEKKLHSDFDEMLKTIRTAGAEAVFLLLPRLDVSFEQQEKSNEREIYRLITRWADTEAGVHILDPLEHLKGHDPAMLRRDYCHYNETGHELMAHYLAGELEKMLVQEK